VLVCVCVCEREREAGESSERENIHVCEWGCVDVRVCVCVREGGREGEIERKIVCYIERESEREERGGRKKVRVRIEWER